MDQNGMTALHYAAINNNFIGAEKLLSIWDTKIDVNTIFLILTSIEIKSVPIGWS